MKFDKDKIRKLCEAITESLIYEDRHACDCCVHCGYKWGNIKFFEGELPHYENCAYVLALDILYSLDD